MKKNRIKKIVFVKMLGLIGLGMFFLNSAQAADCVITGLNGNTTTITSGQSAPYYSDILRTVTGQDYPVDCNPYS